MTLLDFELEELAEEIRRFGYERRKTHRTDWKFFPTDPANPNYPESWKNPKKIPDVLKEECAG